MLRLVPVSAAKSRAAKKTFAHFANALGLVYFGYVDQHADEHELVRGFTLSTEHRDNHYCVGTVAGYDVILVERSDVIRFPNKAAQHYQWVIMQVDLRHADFPHVFFSSTRHPDTYYSHFFVKYARFQKLGMHVWQGHDTQFTQQYAVFGSAEDEQAIGRLFSADTTATMTHQLKGLEFELLDDKLIVYASNQQATSGLLEHIVKHGLWLAAQLDAARTIQQPEARDLPLHQ